VPSGRIRLNLHRGDLEELAAIASESNRLSTIISAAGRVGPRVGIRAVAEEIASDVGMDEADLRPILVGLVNLYQTQTRLKLDASMIVGVVSHNLQRLAKSLDLDDKGVCDSWENAKPKIASALAQLAPDHPILGAAKALRVITSRQYDFVTMKVLTDVRPVFNEKGDVIVQSIIAHVLSIDYHDGQDHHVIQFTLDAQDIADLKKECERAEQKSSVLKQDLKAVDWPTSVFREPIKPAEQGEA
jgi:hypothetical protein